MIIPTVLFCKKAQEDVAKIFFSLITEKTLAIMKGTGNGNL